LHVFNDLAFTNIKPSVLFFSLLLLLIVVD